MNSDNGTIVNSEMLKKLKAAGVSDGYQPVPREMQSQAERALKGREVVDMDKSFRYALTKNQKKAKRRQGVPGY